MILNQTHNASNNSALVDPAEIVRSLMAIVAHDQVIEVRALNAKFAGDWRTSTISGYFEASNLEGLAAQTATITEASGIYFVVNPCNPALLARAVNKLRKCEKSDPTTADHDIVNRRYLLIDCDPTRPAKIASSEEEHDAALDRAQRITDALNEDGWPDPIFADSGNGAHLLYDIDEPSNDAGLIKTVLEAMNNRFGDKAVSIDQTVFNPARIWKLYGTRACKGDPEADRLGRPHRMASLLSVPDSRRIVTHDQLLTLVAKYGTKPEPTKTKSAGQNVDANQNQSDDGGEWIKAFIKRHELNVSGPEKYNGGRKWIFEVCPFNDDHADGSAVITEAANGKLGFKCHHNGCSGKDWHALRDLLEPDRRNRQGEATASKATAPPADDDERNEPPAFTQLMTCGELLDADLRVDYLIPGILVANQPCVIGGLSKACKTTTMVDLAISLSTGAKFLDEWQAQPRKVAIWSGESGAATLRNMAVRIARSKGVELRDASLLWSFDLPKLARHDHLTHLERTITENELEVVVVDPLYLSLLEAADAGNASNVYVMGAKLQPIGEIGQRTGATFVVLHHFKRSAGIDDKEPASLESLSQSGIVEWARQWILLQRRSPYQSDGRHELWLRAGGSAGHAGLWAVDADEGVYDPDGETDGRHWEVTVKPQHEAIQEAQAGKEERQQRAKQDKQAAQDAADVTRLTRAMKLKPEGETRSVLKTDAALTPERMAKALLTLQGTGHAVRIEIVKNKRTEEGFQYIENPGKVDLSSGISGWV